MSDRSELISTGEPFVFDDERDAEFERLIVRYPIRESMIMPALWMADTIARRIVDQYLGYGDGGN